MISTVIVATTVVMAAVFTVAYLASPELRRQVEAPKTIFLQQLRQYDRSIQERRARRSESENDVNAA